MKNKAVISLVLTTLTMLTNLTYASDFEKKVGLIGINALLHGVNSKCVVVPNATSHHTNTLKFKRLKTARNCRSNPSTANKYCKGGEKLWLANNRAFNTELANKNWWKAVKSVCLPVKPKKQEASYKSLHRYNTRLARRCRIKAMRKNGFALGVCTKIHAKVEKKIKDKRIDKGVINTIYYTDQDKAPRVNGTINKACSKLTTRLGKLGSKINPNSMLAGGIAGNIKACENNGFKIPTKLKRKFITLKKKGVFRRK